jgi:alpha-glucosidase (family GH31 glycosyl hydrolase)
MGGLSRRVAPLVVAVSALALPAAASAATADAGALRARIQTNPWQLSFVDRSGRPVLSEHPGTGTGPSGTLGFSTAAGWFHATRVASVERSGGEFVAHVATTDPAGRRLRVEVRRNAPGVIKLKAAVEGGTTADVRATGIGFAARARERYLGFGERSNAVDQRGRTVENYVADGPYQSEEYPFLAPFIPPAGLRPRADSTYFPMPWLLSTAGYGVLIGNTETSYFRLGTDDPAAWSLEAQAPRLILRVFAGPTPARTVRRLTRFTGRQPAAAAPWFFGPWYQPTDGDFPQARKLREADVPASAANTYTHYLPCGDQRGAEAEQRARTAGFHRQGYAVTTYFNPMVCSNYQPVFGEAAAADVLTENAAGEPYLYRYSASTDDLFLVGQFDFSAPGADAFYGRLLGEAVAHGYDGWMEDFGEYTPLDSRSANGMRGTRMHNLYPVLYHRASHRFAKRQRRPVAGFIRSGWTGVHRYAQLVWGGDPTTDWGFDGLRSALTQALTIGTSGISRWGSDIGGFFSLGRRELTPELLVRWIELGAVSGIMRTEANGVAVPPKTRPQVTDPEILPVWRRYAKLRTQLYPYLRAADARYRRTGMPLMRHMALAYPHERAAVRRNDQFMFGPDLLTAPVLEPDQRKREVYLPRGRWVDLGRTLDYRKRRGSLRLGRARLLRGPGEKSIPAALDELPLLARAGTVLPLLPADVDTLARYGAKRPGIVRLRDRRLRLNLLAFPRGRSHARFGRSGLIKSRERPGRWTLTVHGRPRTRYRVQASLATLRDPFVPSRITVDGRPLPGLAWRYDNREQVLQLRTPRAHDTLRVVAAGGRGGPRFQALTARPTRAARRLRGPPRELHRTPRG